MSSKSGSLSAVRVWDLPTRLFHWALVLCVIGLVITGKVGGNAIEWHFRLGYTVFALLAFRLLWGFVGGRWSRFSSFFYGPGALLSYVRGRGEPAHEAGHSPTGALSVWALLSFLAFQVGSGLFADDEIANVGPLAKFISTETSLQLTSYHKVIGQWVIIGLVVLHIVAVLYYLFAKKSNLIGPMFSGNKQLPAALPASTDTALTRVLALVLMAACAAGVAWVVSLGG